MCTLIASLNVYLLYQTLGAGWMAVIVACVLAFAIWVRFFYRGSDDVPQDPGRAREQRAPTRRSSPTSSRWRG